jgi:hypothetical protein
MIFKKLDLVLPPLDLERLKGDPLENYGTAFYSFGIKDTDYLEQILKDRIRFNITPGIVDYNEIPNGTAPHKHTNTEVALNYYIDNFGYTTLFFETKDNEEGVDNGRNLPDGSVTESVIQHYRLDQLKYIDKISIDTGDAYLLDTGWVHAVPVFPKVEDTTSSRKILRWLWWEYTIEEILNSIEILS